MPFFAKQDSEANFHFGHKLVTWGSQRPKRAYQELGGWLLQKRKRIWQKSSQNAGRLGITDFEGFSILEKHWQKGGGCGEVRTPDIRLVRATLSQLSYTPILEMAHFLRDKKVAERTGLEPATPCVTGRYSNQLNYRSTFTDLTALGYLVKRCAAL